MKRIVRRPRRRRVSSASAMTARISLMPDITALNETKCARVTRGDQPRQRRLAGARRAPEDDRLQAVVLDRLAQRTARAEQRLLADELVERARAHALGERCRARAYRRARDRRQRDVHRMRFSGSIRGRRCREASYRISAAAIATLSDSTGGRIGIVSRSSADATRSSASPAPSAPSRIAAGRVRSASAGVVPSRGTVATTVMPARFEPRDRRRASGCLMAIGIRNVLPIAPRSAFQPNGSAVPFAGDRRRSRRSRRRRGRSRRRCRDPGRRASTSTSAGVPRSASSQRRPADAARWRRRPRADARGSSPRCTWSGALTSSAPGARRERRRRPRGCRSRARRRPTVSRCDAGASASRRDARRRAARHSSGRGAPRASSRKRCDERDSDGSRCAPCGDCTSHSVTHTGHAQAETALLLSGVADERAADQEVRGRDSCKLDKRAEDGAAEGDQARARAGRPSRERGVPRGEGAAAPRRVAHQLAAEARQRDPADEPRQACRTTGRLRLDRAPQGRKSRRSSISW